MIGNNTIGLMLIIFGTPAITLVLTILLYRGFRKTFRGSKHGGWWALLPTAVCVPVIGFGTLFVTVTLALWHPNLDFDHDRWLAKPERRYWMTEKLIDSGMLLGLTRSQAEQTLGPEWFYPKDQTYYPSDAPGTYRVDTTRMVWYAGWSPGGLMVAPPNALTIRLEEGAVAEASETRHWIPDGPIVRMSGFVVDPSLGNVPLTARDSVNGWRGTSGGRARVTRYYENGGIRRYAREIPPRLCEEGVRHGQERVAAMRDTLPYMDHRVWNDYLSDRVIPMDEGADVHLPTSRHVEDIHFAYDHHAAGNGCRIVITTDTLSPLTPKGRATVVIESEVRIFTCSDQDEYNRLFVPDSVSLTFDRVPVGGGPLTGRFHARKKEFSRMWPDQSDRLWDVVFEGEFRVALPDNDENP
jgi:hypothetical protein